MKKLRKILLIFLAIIATLAVLVFLLTMGAPKVTVDYLAEYNRISQPENYDPRQNAAPLYKEAFDQEELNEQEEIKRINGFLERCNNLDDVELLEGTLAEETLSEASLQAIKDKKLSFKTDKQLKLEA